MILIIQRLFVKRLIYYYIRWCKSKLKILRRKGKEVAASGALPLLMETPICIVLWAKTWDATNQFISKISCIANHSEFSSKQPRSQQSSLLLHKTLKPTKRTATCRRDIYLYKFVRGQRAVKRRTMLFNAFELLSPAESSMQIWWL